jgi:hypothetical protein
LPTGERLRARGLRGEHGRYRSVHRRLRSGRTVPERLLVRSER